jgi:hypothetical protein
MDRCDMKHIHFESLLLQQKLGKSNSIEYLEHLFQNMFLAFLCFIPSDLQNIFDYEVEEFEKCDLLN